MKDVNKQPGIKFDTIFLVKEQFSRSPEISEEITLELHMDSNISIDDNKAFNELNTKLIGRSEDNTEAFKIDVTFMGIFSAINGEENMGLDDFMNLNSSALMFPYIREHISAITTKAGMQTIFLSPINVQALINSSKEKSA